MHMCTISLPHAILQPHSIRVICEQIRKREGKHNLDCNQARTHLVDIAHCHEVNARDGLIEKRLFERPHMRNLPRQPVDAFRLQHAEGGQ